MHNARASPLGDPQPSPYAAAASSAQVEYGDSLRPSSLDPHLNDGLSSELIDLDTDPPLIGRILAYRARRD